MTEPVEVLEALLFASDAPFDPVKDFTPIVHLMDAEGLLVVNPSVKATTVPELIALARAEPGKLSYGSGGVGTTSHLAGELFRSMAKIDMTHVPYKGAAPAMLTVPLIVALAMMSRSATPSRRAPGCSAPALWRSARPRACGCCAPSRHR